MTTYYCKCGRKVKKSTSADNTGNRDVQDCKGCPYLMDYGPYRYIEGKGFQRDVQGQECRMSPVIDYHTTYMGSANDKCTLRIVSLDLDFLGEVQAWIDDNIHDGDLSGGFSPGSIRPTDYSHNGRVCWSISCAQNRKGMKAKSELIERFFDGKRHRKDIDPATEERMILDKIAAGKAAAHKKEESTLEAKQYKTEFDTVYAVRQLPSGEYRIMCRFGQGEWTKATDPKLSAPCGCAESLQEVLDAEAQRKGWDEYSDAVSAPAASNEPPESVDKGSEPDGRCLCETCTCTGCHDKCFGNCTSCGDPTDECNSYQTDGEKRLPAATHADLAAPSFDYSGLDEATVNDLHLAAREVASGKKMAEIGLRRMADGVAIAHDALVANCDKRNNQYSEDTFRTWCASIGITKDTAYRLLQVAALFDQSSPNEQKVLEELSPSLLYAAAKPSAPAELVQGVKDGDITSHKQYKELLAQLNAEKARADGMVEEINSRDAKINNLIAYSEEADRRTEKEEQKRKDLQRELDAERASNTGSSALLADEQQRRQKADEARIAAEKRAAEAEKSLEGARHVIDASKRRDEKARSEIEDLRSQLADLKSKPIEAPVVDAEELDRMAAEKADAIVEKRLAELAPGEDALRNAHDAVILAVRIIDSISQLLMPHMGVLDNDQIMEACETISRATSKLNGGLARCLKN